MLWFTVLYGIATTAISFYLYMRCGSKADYLLANRKLLSSTVGMTAQTAFLGYFFIVTVPMIVVDAERGLTEAIFSAAGMVVGIFLSRFAVARRIRIYSEVAGNSFSFPEFAENRFEDKTGILRAVYSAVILIFNVIFSAAVIKTAADIFDRFTNIGSVPAILLCGAVVALFVFLGGLPAIATVSHIRAVIILVFFVFITISVINASVFGIQTDVQTMFISEAAKTISRENIASGLVKNILSFCSYAVLFFGIPTISTLYMSAKERCTPKRRVFFEIVWTLPAAVGAVFTGVIVRALAVEQINGYTDAVNVLFTNLSPFLGSAVTALVFVVSLSAAEHGVFSASTAFAYDLFHGRTKKQNELMRLRLSAVFVSAAAVILAIADKDFLSIEAVITLISSAFGPITLFGLFCRFLTAKAAFVSTVGGIASASVFIYFCPTIGLPTIAGVLPCFAIGTLLLLLVSIADQKSLSSKTENEFGRTQEIARMTFNKKSE